VKKLIFVFAVLYGTYWYASSRFNFADTLVYAKKNQYASWSQSTYYYVGLVYYQRAEYVKSQDAFNQLVTDFSTGPYVAKGLVYLSRAAEENRDWPVARQSLERFIEEFPDHKDKPAAIQRLDIIRIK
jgi:outer membrane protein assembly factor BamD (BamD/ComL family)